MLNIHTSVLCGFLLFIVLVAVPTDSMTCLTRIIAMKIECVCSEWEGFCPASFPITDNSFFMVIVGEISGISLINQPRTRHR